MYQISKGKPFYFSLMVLMYTYNIPKNLDKSKLKSFWPLYVVLKSLTILSTVVEPMLHIVVSLKNKTGMDVSEDIAILIGSFGVVTGLILFTVQVNEWMDFMKDVTSFKEFGDIAIFEPRLKYLNIVTMMYYWSCLIGIFFYGAIKYIERTACEQLNEEKNLHELCGAFYPLLIPYIDLDLSKISFILLCFIQMFICSILLPPGAMVSCIVWESTELLIIHTNILKERFIHLFNESEDIACRLRFCVNYHNHILSMASRLNLLFKHTCSHMTFLAALVFGVILNQMMRTTAMTGAIYLVGYIIAIFFFCHSGEIIKNETFSVVDAIWASNWHKADSKTMQDLAFIIARCQTPSYFEAIPIGIFDYSLFVMILKTSYSYLTLLNESM